MISKLTRLGIYASHELRQILYKFGHNVELNTFILREQKNIVKTPTNS